MTLKSFAVYVLSEVASGSQLDRRLPVSRNTAIRPPPGTPVKPQLAHSKLSGQESEVRRITKCRWTGAGR
jgi:hypothetical protein